MRISDWSSDVCSSDLLYGARLTEEGEVDQAWIEAHVAQFTELLEGEFEAAKSYLPNKADWFGGRWSGLSKPAGPETERRNVETVIGKDELQAIGRTLTTVPEDRSEEHTSELQSLIHISYAVFSLTNTPYTPSNKQLNTHT